MKTNIVRSLRDAIFDELTVSLVGAHSLANRLALLAREHLVGIALRTYSDLLRRLSRVAEAEKAVSRAKSILEDVGECTFGQMVDTRGLCRL